MADKNHCRTLVLDNANVLYRERRAILNSIVYYSSTENCIWGQGS